MASSQSGSINVKYLALKNRPHYQSYNVMESLNELMFKAQNSPNKTSKLIGKAFSVWNEIPNLKEYEFKCKQIERQFYDKSGIILDYHLASS